MVIAHTIGDYLPPGAFNYIRFFTFFDICLQLVLHPYHMKEQRDKVLVFRGSREPIP